MEIETGLVETMLDQAYSDGWRDGLRFALATIMMIVVTVTGCCIVAGRIA